MNSPYQYDADRANRGWIPQPAGQLSHTKPGTQSWEDASPSLIIFRPTKRIGRLLTPRIVYQCQICRAAEPSAPTRSQYEADAQSLPEQRKAERQGTAAEVTSWLTSSFRWRLAKTTSDASFVAKGDWPGAWFRRGRKVKADAGRPCCHCRKHERRRFTHGLTCRERYLVMMRQRTGQVWRMVILFWMLQCGHVRILEVTDFHKATSSEYGYTWCQAPECFLSHATGTFEVLTPMWRQRLLLASFRNFFMGRALWLVEDVCLQHINTVVICTETIDLAPEPNSAYRFLNHNKFFIDFPPVLLKIHCLSIVAPSFTWSAKLYDILRLRFRSDSYWREFWLKFQ